MIDKDITIEDLVETIPGSVRYLMEQGIKCIACGEPIWGTLEEAAKEKGFNDEDIRKFVNDLNNLNNGETKNEIKKTINIKKMNTD
jgi:iron-sulfur cluster repair protein YtfE (RIC family)